MRCRGLSSALLSSCGFASNAEAVAAVEFAIILPFLLALYLGSIEAGDGMAVQFKTALATRAVTELTSQYTSIDDSTMSSILGAAAAVVGALPCFEHGGHHLGDNHEFQQSGNDHLERLAPRHGPHGRPVGDASDRAANRQCFLDLERGDVPLPADVRLCAHRHGQHLSEQLFLSAIVDFGDARQFLIVAFTPMLPRSKASNRICRTDGFLAAPA